jgi:hypothetical protein
VLAVNVTGPYNQLQDWPVVAPSTKPIVTGITTVLESANRTQRMMNLPDVEWGVTNTPPLTSTHRTHSRHTAATATATSSDLRTRSYHVPQWTKFGVSKFDDSQVINDKANLRWEIFEDSLDPYWKVGNMVAIWKKIYDLLWPHPKKKRWQLTHAKLINVLREMIDAVPVDEDGAPNKSLIKMARERYNNSLTNLTTKQAVMVSEKEFLPPSTSHISSGFSGFEISTPEDMRLQELQRLQTSKSASSSGSKKRKAPLDSDTSATTSSSFFPSSGTGGTSITSSNLSGKEKRPRTSRG